MIRNEREVVSAVKRGLAERIGQERFELWFSTSVRFTFDDNQFVVAASDQFLLDRLKKQFASDFNLVLAETSLASPAVFQVESALRSDPSQPQSTQSNKQGGAKPASDAKSDQTASGSSPLQTGAAAPAEQATGGRPQRRRFERLDTFVVADGNRVAHAAATTVVKQPGRCSPMFLYGPTGCGKTHLLEGIWSSLRRQTTRSRVLFLSAEQFTSYFLEALRGGGLPNFRRKCRVVDLLVVDDVQFFAGKRATIIELQHTVDALLRSGKQLVLAADRPPSSLMELGTEMIARFSGGLICGIEEADYATRLGIARRFASRMEITFPEEVLELVAADLGGDSRQLCGALNRLEATCLAMKLPLTVSLARATLQEVFRATQRVVRLPDIERAVCDTFGLDPKCLRERTKAKSVSHPRMLAMWLARKYTHAAFSEISEYFGRRSHSTVISAEKKITRLVADGSNVQLGQEACRVQDAIRRVELKLRTG